MSMTAVRVRSRLQSDDVTVVCIRTCDLDLCMESFGAAGD